MQKILVVLVAAAMLYMLMQGTSASTDGAVQGNCVDALHAQYRAQWAEMNALQRAMVGLSAAGCAP
jgi:hypothetical protein